MYLVGQWEDVFESTDGDRYYAGEWKDVFACEGERAGCYVESDGYVYDVGELLGRQGKYFEFGCSS